MHTCELDTKTTEILFDIDDKIDSIGIKYLNVIHQLFGSELTKTN